MSYFLQHLIIALNDGATYALIALGYTMVYGVLRLINFAHGDVFMLGAFIGAYAAAGLAGDLGNPPATQSISHAALGVAIAMLICGAIGYAIERFAYRPLRRSPKLSALITAIGVSLLIEYLAQIQWSLLNLPRRVIRFCDSVADVLHLHGGIFSAIRRTLEKQYFGPNPLHFPPIAGSGEDIAWFTRYLGVSVNGKDFIVIGTTLVTLIVLRFIVLKTRQGKAMRAVSLNYDSAQLMGININRVISFTFVLGSMLAALGGCLYGLNYEQCEPLMGLSLGLKAFVAAVIGGIGNIGGAALGGFAIALIETFVSTIHYHGDAILSPYRDAIAFVILIAVLIMRPEGILGKAAAEKV